MPCSIKPDDRPRIKQTLTEAAFTGPIYAAAAIKLYLCTNTQRWTDTQLIGALTLHRRNQPTGELFLSLLSYSFSSPSNTQSIVWQHEVYVGMQLVRHAESQHFAYFESDNVLFGVLFVSANECEDFVRVFEKQSTASSTAPSKPSNRPIPNILSASACNVSSEFTGGMKNCARLSANSLENSSSFSTISSKSISTSVSPGQPTHNSTKQPVTGKAKKSKKKITRDDIGNPTNFRHISHIGFDAEGGFDLKNIPEAWRVLFEKAGVTKEQLENEETAKFIVDFVEGNGGPPPVPPRRRNVSSSGIKEMEADVGSTANVDSSNHSIDDNNDYVQPDLQIRAPPSLPPAPSSASTLAPQNSHSSLMESIRSSGGISLLKKAPANSNVSHAKLPLNSNEPVACNDMASLLAHALANRQQMMGSDSDCSD